MDREAPCSPREQRSTNYLTPDHVGPFVRTRGRFPSRASRKPARSSGRPLFRAPARGAVRRALGPTCIFCKDRHQVPTCIESAPTMHRKATTAPGPLSTDVAGPSDPSAGHRRDESIARGEGGNCLDSLIHPEAGSGLGGNLARRRPTSTTSRRLQEGPSSPPAIKAKSAGSRRCMNPVAKAQSISFARPCASPAAGA